MAMRDKGNWSFSAADGKHIIAANVETTFTHFVLRISVDGMQVLEKKKMSGNGLYGEYPFRAGQHVGLLKVTRKGLTGHRLELALDGMPVAPGQHVKLAGPQPAAPASPAGPAPSTTHSTTSVPMFPELPSTCANCGAPLSMNDVNWTGPMNAACKSCGSTVRVEWKKIG